MATGCWTSSSLPEATSDKTDEELTKAFGPKTRSGITANRKCNVLGYPCKIYRNIGHFKFQDVSDQVFRINGPWPFSHGAAVADYDRDGYSDLVITGYGRTLLFHNEATRKTPPNVFLWM